MQRRILGLKGDAGAWKDFPLAEAKDRLGHFYRDVDLLVSIMKDSRPVRTDWAEYRLVRELNPDAEGC